MSSQSAKKIAILLPSLKFGGAERAALTLGVALKRAGYEVDVLLMSAEGEFLSEAVRSLNVVSFRCDRTYKLPGKLVAYIAARKPTVLLSSFWKLNLCACIARVVLPRMKLLLWEHSPPTLSKNSPRWLYAITASVFYQLAQRVIAVSTGVCGDIASSTIGLERKLMVIHNPIDPPPPNLEFRRGRGGQKQIVWVGRLDHPKNPGLLLEAFALIAGRSNASVVYVGDGPLRRELESRCRELGLTGRVRFAGYSPKPYEVIASSDLLVLSSDREGLGNVLIEAMYCGLPVVSTDCGKGIHDVLLGGRLGAIVPVRDEAALASAIATELNAPHNFARQVAGARRFLPATIASQFLDAMGLPP